MKLVYAFSFLLIVTSCSQTTESKQELALTTPVNQIAKVKWVCGMWTSQSEQGLLTEKWEQVNDSTLEGKTTFIADGEVQFSETTAIHQEGNELIYTAVVSDQNDGKPVDFNMTSIGEKFAVFENQKHDFPQKIRYELKGNSMVATVSGKENGKERNEVFEMERVK